MLNKLKNIVYSAVAMILVIMVFAAYLIFWAFIGMLYVHAATFGHKKVIERIEALYDGCLYTYHLLFGDEDI